MYNFADMQNRRQFLKSAASTGALALLAGTASNAADASSPSTQVPAPKPEIQVFVTDAERRHQPATSLRWTEARSASPGTLIVDPAKKAQPILGFGAALTDAACYVISQLPEAARGSLLNELFSPNEMGFNVCRICIGSSDYSRSVFSYDEGAPDPELTRFSIAHDREYILPTLRAAREINPDLFLFGSPWSPPGWMKDNNSMLGGTIRRHFMPNYANYFVKFLQAYRGEGVEVNAVTSQNEVDTDQDSRMPACLFPQEVEVQYVGEMLGPVIERAGLPTKIWLLDHNYNLWGRAICELDDEKVSRVTKSIAWHGYLGEPEMVRKVAEAHPDAEMYWTEGGPEITDPKYATDWSQWSRTFTGILRNGMRSITAWNVALDEHGKPNIGPFSCGGLVTVHSQSGEVTRSGQHWAFAHYARHIRRNAVIISSDWGNPQATAGGIEHVAAINPDGSYVLVLTNTTGSPQGIEIGFGNFATQVDLAAESISTLRW
ncbi:MAG TPA: glycoside hydrolase family 30 beta sandwich domain-containing protein [Terriglobales bacterium]|nr:glycoside hydrolase family 30 beta sandwich domain-containing protein [Terriglobales bacterium]